ncbi:hypothetical protein PMIN04_012137 [Paraphaeosphaeria minitans]|uniref:Ethyl tert-butyl ether degradation n=1 Tax=Paraphaeosphaeria minitans TaxID=565426 RepID=A0A9P6KL21_9PLEO|nr:ethyl tert-butyl ether degradation [Paraphaeosphaeria minitans]
MPYHETILFENTDELKLDMDHYLKVHMPLGMERLVKYGLRSYHVVKYTPGPFGPKPRWHVGATLVWESVESVKAAMASGDDFLAIYNDGPKYSNMRAIVTGGEVIDSNSV